MSLRDAVLEHLDVGKGLKVVLTYAESIKNQDNYWSAENAIYIELYGIAYEIEVTDEYTITLRIPGIVDEEAK